jgi:hypothetical protein
MGQLLIAAACIAHTVLSLADTAAATIGRNGVPPANIRRRYTIGQT